jgi:hypothetical protein
MGAHDKKLKGKTWEFTHQLIIQCKTIEKDWKKGGPKHEGRRCSFFDNLKQLNVQFH